MSEVLIVEDEAPIRRLLHRWIDAEGVRAVEAESAEQGLLLASEEFPGRSLLRHQPAARPKRLLARRAIASPSSGDIGRRDHRPPPIRRRRHRFARRRDGLHRQAVYARSIQRSVAARADGAPVAKSCARHTRPPDPRPEERPAGATAALLSVLRVDHEEAVDHARRVSRVAVALARAMNVGEAVAADIEHAAILRNITRLDVHAIGRQVPFLAAASTITAAVQEHFDGTGFPLGLSGERIPLGSRILAVAEAWDELVSGSAPRQADARPGDRGVVRRTCTPVRSRRARGSCRISNRKSRVPEVPKVPGVPRCPRLPNRRAGLYGPPACCSGLSPAYNLSVDFDLSDVQTEWREKGATLGRQIGRDATAPTIVKNAAQIGLLDAAGNLSAATVAVETLAGEAPARVWSSRCIAALHSPWLTTAGLRRSLPATRWWQSGCRLTTFRSKKLAVCPVGRRGQRPSLSAESWSSARDVIPNGSRTPWHSTHRE